MLSREKKHQQLEPPQAVDGVHNVSAVQVACSSKRKREKKTLILGIRRMGINGKEGNQHLCLALSNLGFHWAATVAHCVSSVNNADPNTCWKRSNPSSSFWSSASSYFFLHLFQRQIVAHTIGLCVYARARLLRRFVWMESNLGPIFVLSRSCCWWQPLVW